MTTKEAIVSWLKFNGKKPYCPPGGSIWNWGTEADGIDEDADMLLPSAIFDHMTGRIGYPNCRMYFSEEEAIDDVVRGCENAPFVSFGHIPGLRFERKPVDREMLARAKAARERGESVYESIDTVIKRLQDGAQRGNQEEGPAS